MSDLMKTLPRLHIHSKAAYRDAIAIEQQPLVWSETANYIEDNRDALETWLAPILELKGLRIIITNVEAPACLHETLAPHLSTRLNINVDVVSASALIDSPSDYVTEDIPTLLISIISLGNSPENVAAYQFAESSIETCFHLVITSNQNDALANHVHGTANGFSIFLPFQVAYAPGFDIITMVLALLCIFTPAEEKVAKSISIVSDLITKGGDDFKSKAEIEFDNAVFLGASVLQGIASEASLYMSTCTNGKIGCHSDSIIGFQQGSQFSINPKTLIMVLSSQDEYSKHDTELINELLSETPSSHILDLHDFVSQYGNLEDDIWLAFPYLIICQILVLHKSLALKNAPAIEGFNRAEIRRLQGCHYLDV